MATVDLVAQITADKTTAYAGETITYSITAINNGPGDATRIQYSFLNLPADFVDREFSSNGGVSWSEWPAIGYWRTGMVPAGDDWPILFRGRLLQSSPITRLSFYLNATTVTGDTDPNSANNTAEFPVDIVPMVIGYDLSVVKTADKTKYTYGETVKFTIVVTNPSNIDVTYTLADTITDYGPYYNTPTWSENDFNYLAWDDQREFVARAFGTHTVYIKSVLTGATNAKLSNTATISTADITDPNLENNTSTVEFDYEVTSNMTVTKTTDRGVNGVYYPGEEITFIIEVENQGPRAAQGVTITDSLLPQISNPVFGVSGAFMSEWTGSRSYNYPIGSKYTFLLTGTVEKLSNYPLNATNTVSIDSTSMTVLGQKTASVPFVIEKPIVDLSVVKTVSKSLFAVGEVVTFTISTTNPSGLDIYYTLSDVLPTGLENPMISTNGTTYTAWTGVGNFTAMANSVSTIFIRGAVQDRDGVVEVSNTATVSSSEINDPDTTNNESTVNFTIGSHTYVELDKSVDRGQNGVYYPGDTIVFTIVTENFGPMAVKDALIEDEIGFDVSDMTYTVNGVPMGEWTGSHFESSLAVGNHVIVITGKVPTPSRYPSVAFNRATISSTKTKLDGNLQDVVNYTRNGIYELSVTKKSDKAIYLPNDPIEYTLTVKNKGPHTVSPEVFDELPSVITNPRVNYKNNFNDWNGSLRLDPLVENQTEELIITGTVTDSAISNTASVRQFD